MGLLGFLLILVIWIDFLLTVGSGGVANDNGYNRVISYGLRETISQQLPKEAKFFDDFDRKIKYIYNISHFNLASKSSVVVLKKVSSKEIYTI
ncbi:hypothetical protein DMENIID0001_027680 [Sergentomyia squamirostris]